MFNEIGKKIKIMAWIFLIIAIAASIIIGILLLWIGSSMKYGGEGLVLAGSLTFSLGWIPSYLAGLFIYGFGELIDKTVEIAENTASNANDPITKTAE